MGQAKRTPEQLQPISTPRESNILSSDEIDAIAKIAVGQANNEAWHQQREGRITASNFYRVFTKVESMQVNEENSADKLVDSLLGKAKPPTNLPALKYGRDMGPLQLRNSSNTSKNTTRMLGIENVVSLLIKLNSTWEHPLTYCSDSSVKQKILCNSESTICHYCIIWLKDVVKL